MSKANQKFSKITVPEAPKVSREENMERNQKVKNFNNSKKMI
jgi:hypothetical protein